MTRAASLSVSRPTFRPALLSRRFAPLALSLWAVGCAPVEERTHGGLGPVEEPGSHASHVNAFAEQLPTWEEFSPTRVSENVPDPDSDPVEEVVDGYDCTTTAYSLTETPEEIVLYDPDSEILFLGALLQGSGYAARIGSLEELPIRQRAPLTLSIDLLTEDNTATVDDPDLGSVKQAIGELIARAERSGHDAGSDTYFVQEEAHSVQQSALQVGLSARYMGGSASANLEFEQAVDEHTLTAHFVQQMFTTSMVLPQTPADLFSADFTEERLQEQVDLGRMGPDSPPAYVSSIVWGRVMTFTMTSTDSVEAMKRALNASYDTVGAGGSGQLSAENLGILERASIEVVTIGGDDDNARALLQSGQLAQYFASESPLTSARPISYTVRSLSDNDIATVSETTEYDLRECDAPPPVGMRYEVTFDSLQVTRLGCEDGEWLEDDLPEVYYQFLVNGQEVAGLTEDYAVDDVSLFQSIDLSGAPPFGATGSGVGTLSLRYDGSTAATITGAAWDEDDGNNELIGGWVFIYRTPDDVESRTSSSPSIGVGCDTQLTFTISEGMPFFD